METTDSNELLRSPAKYTVLLVDDDIGLCKLMTEYLGKHEYTVESAYNGRDGLARALEKKVDLVILDGMLPILDGLEVLRLLRKTTSVPVIFLTARTHERDRITGLDSGADDYLPKPFSPDELLARMRAVLRRCSNPRPTLPEVLRAGPLELNPGTHKVTRSGRAIALTETESLILELLMRSAGRTVTRAAITAALYQRETNPFERSIDVHVSRLRKKVEDDGPALIRAVRNAGYVIMPEEE